MSEEIFGNEFNTITSIVDANQWFLVTGHVDPDGDCIGSMLAVARFLAGRGKQVHCFVSGEIPEAYTRLPGFELFVPAEMLPALTFEVIVALDSPTTARAEVIAGQGGRRQIVNIDHHPTNTRYGTVNVVDEHTAAAAVLVYRYLAWEAPDAITPEIADALYLGILMDTGGFRFQNTNVEALETAARLVERGAHPYELAREHIYMNSIVTLKLLAMVLASLEVHGGGKIAVLSVTGEMLREAGASFKDTEGFVDYAASIDDVELSALLREIGPREIRVSLRSRNSFDVASLAEKFDGGGHRKAAGLTVRRSLEEAKAIIIGGLRQLLAGEENSPDP
ncbi:MAG TPA: bifunctional oligoribonuclease/PAP phosphatase NrnA [Patescibacteria group bacterium]|nr:bifunctional oligoribonuclease/PAP phosphatase NrnA [Patescibacteria group bacterium]